jgi:hypothetical protein
MFIVDVLETWSLHYDKFKRGRHASNVHPITEIWVKGFLNLNIKYEQQEIHRVLQSINYPTR